jgi:hypothetical protein
VEQESTLAFSKQPANEICNVPFYSSQKHKILRGYSSLKVILYFQFHYVWLFQVKTFLSEFSIQILNLPSYACCVPYTITVLDI